MSALADVADASVLLVGCGKMGGALLGGWLDQGLPREHVSVIEPSEDAAAFVRAQFGVTVLAGPDEIAPGMLPDILVLAVKPQVMADVLPPYARFTDSGAAVLSIAAGRTIESLNLLLGEKAAVIRCMPNTPAAVRRGITVACGNDRVDEGGRALADALLSAVGEVAWVDDEALLDAVTAVSGSGPAYVFLLIECLARAGEKVGLAPDLAARLALATVAGSGELARLSDEDAAQLRVNVTSPGGTTAAALDVLMADGGLAALIEKAVDAAANRSRELAG